MTDNDEMKTNGGAMILCFKICGFFDLGGSCWCAHHRKMHLDLHLLGEHTDEQFQHGFHTTMSRERGAKQNC